MTAHPVAIPRVDTVWVARVRSGRAAARAPHYAVPHMMSADDEERRPEGPPRPGLLTLAGIGGMNAGCLLAGMGLGWWLDGRFGTTPLFIFLGLLSGILAGVLATYVEVRKYLKD
jgi:ATP synthase protein I